MGRPLQSFTEGDVWYERLWYNKSWPLPGLNQNSDSILGGYLFHFKALIQRAKLPNEPIVLFVIFQPAQLMHRLPIWDRHQLWIWTCIRLFPSYSINTLWSRIAPFWPWNEWTEKKSFLLHGRCRFIHHAIILDHTYRYMILDRDGVKAVNCGPHLTCNGMQHSLGIWQFNHAYVMMFESLFHEVSF